MARREFSVKVKGDAWKRCKGFCEQCTAKLFPGQFDYDHRIPDGLGGEPTLENCQVLCKACHLPKTAEEDRPLRDKADAIRKKHLGQKSKRPFPKRRDPWGKERGAA